MIRALSSLHQHLMTEAPAKRGWNLLEGGVPLTYHADLDRVRVLINPVVLSVPGR